MANVFGKEDDTATEVLVEPADSEEALAKHYMRFAEFHDYELVLHLATEKAGTLPQS